MKKRNLFLLMVMTMLMFISASFAQEKLTAAQILNNVDDLINAPQDQDIKVKLLLTDKDGREEIRELNMLQKGSEKRIARFTQPASQKGIAFLSLPNDTMYLYLPAFKKTRRIASHVKNTKFAGTDFTYEDMEAKRYGDKYIPSLLSADNNQYILELKPKAGVETDYSKLLMWVSADNFYPVKIEHYDRGEKLYKVLTAGKIEQVGKYLVAKESEINDLKTNHKSKMTMQEVKYDTGLTEDLFTERYLSR